MKKNSKKMLNGFTLVELLAVIVILAIIMIIAIPAVLNTLQSSRRKTMVEFAQKVLITGQRKYLEDKSFNGIANISRGSYYYSIKDDLGISNTGDFDGYYIVWVDEDGAIDEAITIWDKEYIINRLNEGEGEIKDSDIVTHSQYKQKLSDIFHGDQTKVNKFSDLEHLDKRSIITYDILTSMTCDNDYDLDIYFVDVSNPRTVVNACQFLNE